MRTADKRLYVEHDSGDREYYEDDPYELASAHAALENTAEVSDLSFRLAVLRDCAGDTCRVTEMSV